MAVVSSDKFSCMCHMTFFLVSYVNAIGEKYQSVNPEVGDLSSYNMYKHDKRQPLLCCYALHGEVADADTSR